MLKWILDHGCPIHPIGDLTGAASLAQFAAAGDCRPVLDWLVSEHGVVLANTKALQGAAYGGHVALMEWLMQQGCLFTPDVSDAAATHDTLANSTVLLEWIRHRGQLMLGPATYYTVLLYGVRHASGCLTVMKWLREVANHPWDAATLALQPARRGAFECLRYIHQHGGLFTAEQLQEQLHLAVVKGHDHIADWLRAQGAVAHP